MVVHNRLWADQTCNPRFLPFREQPILEDVVGEWDVVVGTHKNDPAWRALYRRLRDEETEFFADVHSKNWNPFGDIAGHVFAQHQVVWINDRQTQQEYWDTIIHEFLHAYELEAIDHSRAIERGMMHASTALWTQTFARYGVQLPRQYFPEAQIIQEASTILTTRPDIAGFFSAVYPHLNR